MSACSTDEDYIGGVWLEIPISVFPVIILQILWLFRTLHSEYNVFKVSSPNKIYKTQCGLYLLQQVFGLFWPIMDVFRFVIDPHTLILRGNIGCFIAAYTPIITPGVYYGLYLYQILLRLEDSFKDSLLAISKRTVLIFKLLIVPIISGPLWFIILNQNEAACVRGWKSKDFSSWYERSEPYKFAYCDVKTRHISAAIVLIVLLFLFVSVNVAFGLMFGLKLKKLLTMIEYQDNVSFRYKALIVRKSILTIIGSVSTVVAYLFYLVFLIAAPQYIDLLINSLVIGLMFTYNTKLYKRLCRCCIVMCFMQCDKSESKVNEEEMERYVNNEMTLSSVKPSNTKERHEAVTSKTMETVEI